ncbi:glycoside hydrolase family 47 protein [Aulographum hederae CBS 113979]|uniref:alpha-1,2-Mannosidase n=1 Tax=Aulographum hederae CBS 113979 TaxID=1176131 RepID=A0A6G1GN20_9PEZI|nr:glycoside hydrolase family 47 protein [Aulographum hederae CBS 113979]
MNNRDPFNLRRNPALSLLQTSASRAANRALDYTSQAIETSKQALEDFQHARSRTPNLPKTPTELAEQEEQEAAAVAASSSGMSFSVPRNVPNFQDPARGHEDQAWLATQRPRQGYGYGVGNGNGNGNANTGNGGVAEKIGGMFGDKGLPMYKDKPYNYGASRRRLPWFRRKRVVAVVTLGIVGLLWWMGILGGGKTDVSDTGKQSHKSWGGKGKGGKIDWEKRQEAVKDAFQLSWKAYEKHAWGYDEFHPVSKSGRQMVPPHGLGWIIVDALDTLILMNLTTELTHAREWVSKTLNYDADHDVNTFETTIRMLGGLLSAHYLSTEFPDMAPLPGVKGSQAEDLYLEKASDLADRLLGAYESNSGVPYASINLHTMKGIPSHTDGGASSTAEVTSLQLEMKYLAKLTGETNYWERAEKVMQVVDDNGVQDGLVPIFIHADSGTFSGSNIRLGSRGDSYYEYLIKQYLQTSRQEPIYLSMWDDTMAGIKKHLITYTKRTNLTILGERPSGLNGKLEPKMDHLVCFMPGTIALAATGGISIEEFNKREKTGGEKWDQKREDDLQLATELMKTCWAMYKYTPTGLAAEITYFDIDSPPRMLSDGIPQSPEELDLDTEAEWKKDLNVHPMDRHNLQRPETVESLFYMWRITGDQKYRDWGWEMFESFMEHTLLSEGGGFTSINDVMSTTPHWRDNMESFWLAETLKYFYLLFGPDSVLPLDTIVLNTEAHPFPRFELGKLFSTGWRRKPRDENGNILAVTREEPPLKSANQKHQEEKEKSPPPSPPSTPQEEQKEGDVKMIPLQKPDPVVFKPVDADQTPNPDVSKAAEPQQQQQQQETPAGKKTEEHEMIPLKKPDPVVFSPQDGSKEPEMIPLKKPDPVVFSPQDSSKKPDGEKEDPVERMQRIAEEQIKKGEAAKDKEKREAEPQPEAAQGEQKRDEMSEEVRREIDQAKEAVNAELRAAREKRERGET